MHHLPLPQKATTLVRLCARKVSQGSTRTRETRLPLQGITEVARGHPSWLEELIHLFAQAPVPSYCFPRSIKLFHAAGTSFSTLSGHCGAKYWCPRRFFKVIPCLCSFFFFRTTDSGRARPAAIPAHLSFQGSWKTTRFRSLTGIPRFHDRQDSSETLVLQSIYF